MGQGNDWFDDFMEMKMIEDSEDDSGDKIILPSSNGGCLALAIGVFAFLSILSLFVS